MALFEIRISAANTGGGWTRMKSVIVQAESCDELVKHLGLPDLIGDGLAAVGVAVADDDHDLHPEAEEGSESVVRLAVGAEAVQDAIREGREDERTGYQRRDGN